jgi:hypothetical protein
VDHPTLGDSSVQVVVSGFLLADSGGLGQARNRGSSVVGDKIRQWIKWGVALSLLPFGFLCLVRWSTSGKLPGIVDLFGGGQLLLLEVTFCAKGLGEIIGEASPKRFAKWRNLTGLLTAIFLALSSLWFGVTTTNLIFQPVVHDAEKGRVAWGSLVLLVLTIPLTGFCVALGVPEDTAAINGADEDRELQPLEGAEGASSGEGKPAEAPKEAP